MTTKRIVFTRPDGGVSIVVPSDWFMTRADAEGKPVFASEVGALASVQAKCVPPGATDIKIVEIATLPTDREFRNAWQQTGGVISTNMAKARELHADKIAVAINSEVALLTVEQRRQKLRGNTAAANAAEADKASIEALDLAALATQIAAAANVAALRAIWPARVPRP